MTVPLQTEVAAKKQEDSWPIIHASIGAQRLSIKIHASLSRFQPNQLLHTFTNPHCVRYLRYGISEMEIARII